MLNELKSVVVSPEQAVRRRRKKVLSFGVLPSDDIGLIAPTDLDVGLVILCQGQLLDSHQS